MIVEVVRGTAGQCRTGGPPCWVPRCREPRPRGPAVPSLTFPSLHQFVLDSTDIRSLAEFYRQLLGYSYRPGDEPPPQGTDDERGRDWLVLVEAPGTVGLAFQQVPRLPASTWPEDGVAQQAHLDLVVSTREELEVQHARALELGARVLSDRSDDATEALRVYADPAGHPFCIFVHED